MLKEIPGWFWHEFPDPEAHQQTGNLRTPNSNCTFFTTDFHVFKYNITWYIIHDPSSTTMAHSFKHQ